MRRWAELVGAFCLLTRLPAGRLAAVHPPPGDCVWAYPLVGAAVGSLAAAVLRLGQAAGMAQPVAAAWALASAVLVIGGLHEDGLADTADGFGGARTRERRLAIMRDSRIGSYGALAVAFGLALRAVPLALSTRPERALLLAGVLGRGAMLLPVLLLRPARPDGLGASLRAAGRGRLLAGLATCAVMAYAAPGAGLAALAAGLVVTALAQRQVGGYTGDVLGAAEVTAECAALAMLG